MGASRVEVRETDKTGKVLMVVVVVRWDWDGGISATSSVVEKLNLVLCCFRVVALR